MNGSDALVSARRKGWKGIKGGNRGLVWREEEEEEEGWRVLALVAALPLSRISHGRDENLVRNEFFFPPCRGQIGPRRLPVSDWLRVPLFFPLQKTLYPLPLERLPPTNTPLPLVDAARARSTKSQISFEPVFRYFWLFRRFVKKVFIIHINREF